MLIGRCRDPVSGLTHLVGVVLSVVGAVLLFIAAAQHTQVGYIVAASIFGASLLLLYTASTLYHLLPLSDRGTAILRRVDHMMIFVLIAGTYTPLCLITLAGKWGWILLGTIWGLAAVGVAMKLFWFNAPRWFSTLFYVFMGVIVVAFLPLLSGMLSLAAVAWIAGGGILYIVGAIIYAAKPSLLNFSKWFGFHEVFHLFVLGGSFCHFWFIYRYVLA